MDMIKSNYFSPDCKAAEIDLMHSVLTVSTTDSASIPDLTVGDVPSDLWD